MNLVARLLERRSMLNKYDIIIYPENDCRPLFCVPIDAGNIEKSVAGALHFADDSGAESFCIENSDLREYQNYSEYGPVPFWIWDLTTPPF